MAAATTRSLVSWNRENLNALIRLLETEDLRVVIERTYPLDETASAITHVLEHHAAGKVAIAV